MQEPLITVGLPTFQRAHTLRRAVDSVLAQTYGNLELILADNASQDATEAICEEYRQLDRRVRYFRQATNVGPTENFNSILGRARGEYIIFLGDDDWIEATCLGHCFQALKEHPDRVLAHGRVRYFDGEELIRAPEPLDLIESSPSKRVKAYYHNVGWNEEFYGLIRQDVWARVAPIPKGIGSDYGFVARMVFLGKAVTLDTIEINRTLGGIGGHAAEWARADGLSLRQARSPTLSAAWFAALDLAWRSPVYQTLPSGQRFALVLRCIPIWTLRRYRIEVQRQRERAVYKVRKRSRSWSRRLDRSWHRSLKKASKRVRVARRRSVRLLRRRVGALVLRR